MLHDSLMASTRAQVLYTGQKFPIGKNAPYGNRSQFESLARSPLSEPFMLKYGILDSLFNIGDLHGLQLHVRKLLGRLELWRVATLQVQSGTAQPLLPKCRNQGQPGHHRPLRFRLLPSLP